MSLVVNHNLMAANVARNLNSHYNRLQTSTQRLSSGLRVNSAADDAAGLAIRELQRADIAALHQGARNANDAISLIQTADGAMGVIDEKLIRLKELAEQAATGTYNSTQRLMIESEYQAMCDEITRIANATDFNGIKLLDGTLSSAKHDGSNLDSTGKLKVHFGAGNDSAEDYYYITVGEVTAHALSLGHESTWDNASSRITSYFADQLESAFSIYYGDPAIDQTALKDLEKTWIDEFATHLDKVTNPANQAQYNEIMKLWHAAPGDPAFLSGGKETGYTLPTDDGIPLTYAQYTALSERDQERWRYAWGRAALYNYGNVVPADYTAQVDYKMGTIGGEDMKFGEGKIAATKIPEATARELLDKALKSTWQDTKHYDYAGMTIQTQEDAQIALRAINDAIEQKDKIRAHLGAMQNRLENTITNLNTQAENLQAAESRISDVDVATEMTEFVRNQILTQSAVAMLSQANSLPQMAMQLIGG